MTGHPGKGRCIAVAISFFLCNALYIVIPRNDAMEPKNRTALKIAIYGMHLKTSNITSFEKHTLREQPNRAYTRSCIIISMAQSAIAPAILNIISKATQLLPRISWCSVMIRQAWYGPCFGGISWVCEKVHFGDIHYEETNGVISYLSGKNP